MLRVAMTYIGVLSLKDMVLRCPTPNWQKHGSKCTLCNRLYGTPDALIDSVEKSFKELTESEAFTLAA
jgi:hypothetical protein